MRHALLLCLLLLSSIARADDTEDLVNKLQHCYESTTDFSANFTQEYKYAAMGRTQKSGGTVQVKKPGFMRWDYTKAYPVKWNGPQLKSDDTANAIESLELAYEGMKIG